MARELARTPTNAASILAFHSNLLANAPDAVVATDQNLRISYWNFAAEAMFGWSAHEALGRAVIELLGAVPQGRSQEEAHASLLATERFQGEVSFRRKDGTWLAADVRATVLHDAAGEVVGFVTSARDVSDRKRAEEAARLSAERLASAVEAIPEPLSLWDASERLVLCNSAYRRIVDQLAEERVLAGEEPAPIEVRADPLFTLARDTDQEAFNAARPQRRSVHGDDYTIRLRDGRTLRVTSRRTDEGGLVTIANDLTDDLQREWELEQARRAAESASSAKSEFLASMSHELRTPLNAILGFAQLLRRDRRDPLSDRHGEMVSQILKGGEQLLRLIDDILDFARVEASGVSIAPEPVDAGFVVHEIVSALQPSAREARVELRVADVPEDLPMIEADEQRFSQILMNFGSNAVKYNRLGGTVTFVVSVPEENTVRVSVVDTGIGIPESEQDRLFQPFFRAGQETGPIQGTGIGLAISRRLAELMRGRVGMRSEAGKGSEFWVDMPVHTSRERVSRPVKPAPSSSSQLVAVARALVLYVEDNSANVAFVKRLLEGSKLHLVSAPSAEVGLEIAKTQLPDIVLMDLNLPGMDGFEALRALRHDERTRNIPVIALTAAASTEDRQRATRAGFARYLTKPVRIEELEDALREVLA